MLELGPLQAMPARLGELTPGQLFVADTAAKPVLAVRCDAGNDMAAWVTLSGERAFSIIEGRKQAPVWALPYKPEGLALRFELASGKVSQEWARGLLMLSPDDGLGFAVDWADAPDPDYLRGIAVKTWSIGHYWRPRLTFSSWALCAKTDTGEQITLASFKDGAPA